MIEYLIGVDGGGTGTRVRLATAGGVELAFASAHRLQGTGAAITVLERGDTVRERFTMLTSYRQFTSIC